jgi:hypothetical protein
MDTLELRRAMDELGGGQPQFGKFALENEFHGGRFIGADPAQFFSLDRTLLIGRLRGGRGWFRLRARLCALPGRLVAGLVARPLE